MEKVVTRTASKIWIAVCSYQKRDCLNDWELVSTINGHCRRFDTRQVPL